MLEPVVGEELSVGLVNAVLLALWAVLPGLLLAFARQTLAVRRMRPEFSLRKSETMELDRAVALYAKVCGRLKEINDPGDGKNGLLNTLLGRQAEIPQHLAEEIADLEAHANHLRATISRLKRRPLYRLTSWIHILSSQFALGRALAAHVVGLALLIVAFHISAQPAWAGELSAGAGKFLVWYPLDERFFYANAIAAGFAAVTAPTFYLVRRAGLRREYGLEFCAFRELADADPGQVIDRLHADQDPPPQADANEAGGDSDWFAVLGVSPAATVDEVKEAYKVLIKQNHPDRVHDMSPVFRKLAETETKKLNAAYQQALVSLSPLASA